MSQLTASQWFALKFDPTYARPDTKIKNKNESQVRCYLELLVFCLVPTRKRDMHIFFFKSQETRIREKHLKQFNFLKYFNLLIKY